MMQSVIKSINCMMVVESITIDHWTDNRFSVLNDYDYFSSMIQEFVVLEALDTLDEKC